MARKSNKTAHVLNLLSGQSANEEPEKEPEQPQEEKKEEKAERKAEGAAADTTPAPEPVPAKAQAASLSPEVPANISIIDSTAKEAEPIARRIHEKLLKELESDNAALFEEEKIPASEEVKAAAAPSSASEEPITEAAPSSTAEEQRAESSPSSVIEKPKTEAPALREPEEEILDLSPEPAAVPEPPAEPEPDYVMLNVMQRVVEDKIIYFMKQFEVCTCDRCKADTIALTLSGLPAKYRIVDKNAVDPLVSYYTNRLISQVTVEALKACIQVKDNPRH